MAQCYFWQLTNWCVFIFGNKKNMFEVCLDPILFFPATTWMHFVPVKDGSGRVNSKNGVNGDKRRRPA